MALRSYLTPLLRLRAALLRSYLASFRTRVLTPPIVGDKVIAFESEKGSRVKRVAEREGLTFRFATLLRRRAALLQPLCGLRIEPVRTPPNFKLRTLNHKHIFRSAAQKNWRRGRDSNPRNLSAQRFSRPPQSTTLPPLRDDVLVRQGRSGTEGSRLAKHVRFSSGLLSTGWGGLSTT